MPEESGSQEVSGEPPSQAAMQPPPQPPGNQNPPAQPADDNPINNQSTAAELKKIKAGESWLIAVGIITLLVNSYIAYVYTGQLTQMRIATEASRRAVDLASDTLEYSNDNFDRGMQKTIDQTISQYQATQQAIISANAARSAAATANSALVDGQRAFVYAKPVIRPQNRLGETKPFGIQVIVTWTNSGETPAKGMTVYPHRDGGIPDKFNFRDSSQRGWVPNTLAPKDTISNNSVPIPVEKFIAPEGTLITTLWGWATYHDVFAPKREHLTEYCFRMLTYIDSAGGYNAREESCTKHNCADEDCKVQ
jgi:hypothetical protein